MNLEAIVNESLRVVHGFRWACLNGGYTEHQRHGLRSTENQSIRFNNSSISVLASQCDYDQTPMRYLFQPALRLRNQVFLRRTGKMSPFGCYFVAFGTIAPPATLREAFAGFESFFLDSLGIPVERLVIRGTGEDEDLMQLLETSRVTVEIDGCDRRLFRHRFGLDGVAGRNVNMAIVSRGAVCDVANLIIMERGGDPWAIETAFGINNIVTRLHELEHPVEATTATELRSLGGDLAAMDALSSAVALAIEGFSPRSRGREGNYRAFVSKLLPLWPEHRNEFERVITRVIEAETRIRAHISKRSAGETELSSSAAAERLMSHIEQLASSGAGIA